MKYTREVLEEAVKHCKSFAHVTKYINGRVMSSSMQTHVANRIRRFGIDHSHFTGQGHMKGKPARNRRSAEEILVLRTGTTRDNSYSVRAALIEIGRDYVCEKCGLRDEWNGMELVLQVDHIDGNGMDNREENLRFLCPNCHTQTPTFGKRPRPRAPISVEGAG